MHIYFSGISGAGIGPLALIAQQAGYTVSGSDSQDSRYIPFLKSKGIENIHIGQSKQAIASVHAQHPIDWFVHSSAITKNNPERVYCAEQNIKSSKRDELLNKIIADKNLKLIAIAGTHGKTTTTAMVIWAFKQLGIPISYSVGAKLPFGEPGEFNTDSEYFVYEADEYDRNFLSFYPFVAIIPGIAYDHPDIYPSQQEYNQAFVEFLEQSKKVFAHAEDLNKINYPVQTNPIKNSELTLTGEVNRQNAALVIEALSEILHTPAPVLTKHLNKFPGLSRRFEQVLPNIYSDYAHTPEKIQGALQMAHEVAGNNVVVVYEGLHNTRQHFIKNELKHLFDNVKKIYVVPSYRAREDESLEDLTPKKLIELFDKKDHTQPAQLDQELANTIADHAANGDLVLCLTAGGGNSLDELLRKELR